MTERPEIEPTYDAPYTVAINDLTVFEIFGIEKHFKLPLEKMSSAQRMTGTVWALKNRTEATSWDSLNNVPGRELAGYFQPEPEDEEDDSGKALETDTPES